MEVKTPSGLTVFFRDKLSYGNYLKFQQDIVGDKEMEIGKPVTTFTLRAGNLLLAKDKALDYFITKIVDKEGKEIPNPAQYVRDLDQDEAQVVDEAIEKLLGENMMSKKKPT
jgi:hypothetical protein